jgi:hypothetical protein
MKIFKALGSGCLRSIKTWKGIIIFWFISLALVSVVALPMKSAMKAGFGQSAITGRLMSGIDIEALSDLGTVYSSLTHYFSAGLLLLLFLWVLVNAFFTGGLFNCLKSNGVKFSSGEFFRASSRNFIPFLGITVIISTILIILALIFIVIPFNGITSSVNPDESVPWNIMFVSVLFYVLISQIFVLVADYARAWQVKNEKPACFRAIGFGFSRTFRRFLSSFPMMLIIWIIQTLFVILVLRVIGRWKPVTGIGIIGLFLLSQFLFFMRLLLKVWRYGSVTTLKELNDPSAVSEVTVTL